MQWYQWLIFVILVVLSCMFVHDRYYTHRIVNVELFGDAVKLGVTADNKVHLDVAASPQVLMDEIKGIINTNLPLENENDRGIDSKNKFGTIKEKADRIKEKLNAFRNG